MECPLAFLGENIFTMEAKDRQLLFEQIGKATKILIALPENLHADALASGLALRLFLEKLKKDVEVASSAEISGLVDFLPKVSEVKQAVQNVKSLVVELDTTQKKLDELSYQVLEDKVQIFLKSKGEAFASNDLKFKNEKFPLDLIIILGCQDFEDLGRLFRDNTEIFYTTPKINLDNKPGNEYFGAINVVDITATSLAEILAGLFEEYEQQLVDEQIATCLLTGIITQTNSFQHAQTTPQALMKASRLVALGGRQQEIIKYVYKNKSLPLLKLWGRALAKLKVLEDKSAAYSILGSADFEKTEAGEDLLLPALKELLLNISGYRILGILAQSRPGGPVRFLFALHMETNSEIFEKQFGQPVKVMDAPGEPYRIFEFVLPSLALPEAENLLVSSVFGVKTAV